MCCLAACVYTHVGFVEDTREACDVLGFRFCLLLLPLLVCSLFAGSGRLCCPDRGSIPQGGIYSHVANRYG
jgi:hypothetical protein